MNDGGRMVLARRLARVILIMLGRRYMPNIDWMAATLGVSRRTVYRDLEALEAAGWHMPPTWQGEAGGF